MAVMPRRSVSAPFDQALVIIRRQHNHGGPVALEDMHRAMRQGLFKGSHSAALEFCNGQGIGHWAPLQYYFIKNSTYFGALRQHPIQRQPAARNLGNASASLGAYGKQAVHDA
ncbi:hypothetical protein WJ970_12575 [Achromobacter xylosoxidans]